MHDTTSVMARRRPRSRAEHVAEDIRRQIASGAFRQGERLASYKELGERYGVGQGTINSAIRKLVRQGLVVTERRAGAFVAHAHTGSDDARPPRPAQPLRHPAAVADSFFRPLEPPRGGLRLYISELFPNAVQFWSDLLRDHAARTGVTVELQTCVDGHLQELAQQKPFDLIETTPWVLSAMRGQGVAGPTLEQVGRQPHEFLPLARPWVGANGGATGIPFMATLSYLFVNLDLLEQVDVQVEPPRGGVELYRTAAEVDRRLRQRGLDQRGMELGTLHDMLILEGACRWRDDQLIVSMDRLRRCVATLLDIELPQAVDAVLMPERFVAGEVALLHHCSFLTLDLKQRAKFRWAMLPLIQPDGWPLPARLSVISVDPQCKSPLDTLAIVRFLFSDEVQLGLARQAGRVPVLASAALASDVCASHPAGEAYPYMIEHSSCAWPQEVVDRLAACTPIAALTQGIDRDERSVVDRVLGSLAIGFAGRLLIE